MGAPAPFSFEALKKRARDMAARPMRRRPDPRPEVLEQIDYDAHGKIKFKTGPGALGRRAGRSSR